MKELLEFKFVENKGVFATSPPLPMTYLKTHETAHMDIFKKKDKPDVDYDPNKTFVHPDEVVRREEAAKA